MSNKYRHPVHNGNLELLFAVAIIGFGTWVVISWFLDKCEFILQQQVW